MREHELAKLRFAEGLAAGLALASIFGVAFLFLHLLSESYLSDFSNLFLGLIAIISAYTTVRAIRVQVFQTESHEKERWERRARAKRAMLPLLLSDLYRIGWNAAIAIWKIDLQREAEWRSLVPRVLELEQMIECFEKEEAEELSRVMSCFQLLFARTDMLLDGRSLHAIDAFSDAVDVGNLTVFRTDRVIQWIEFMILIESGFAFARGEVDELRLDHNPNAARILNLLRFRVDPNAEDHPLWNDLSRRVIALAG